MSDNWVQTSAPSSLSWQAIASSTDGSKLAAVVNGGGIYTSVDRGITWVQTLAPSNYWNSIASSADGSKLAAVVNNGNIYISGNSGVTWVETSAPSNNWNGITSSAD